MVALKITLEHLVNDAILAAAEYDRAEDVLSAAWSKSGDPSKCEIEKREAKRRAAQVAIAIDGLTDRAAKELGVTKEEIRLQISPLCEIDGVLRDGCHDRVRGVANAYKHHDLKDPSLPILSNDDVLVAGLGYGLDGFGVGKCGGLEVLVTEKDGTQFKFLGDVPWSIAGWFRFLNRHGVPFPDSEYKVCNLQVYP